MRTRQLTAEIVSIGDEMTSGARLDTNGQWLSRRVQDLGIKVEFHSTVGDTLEHNVDVFRIASQRADIVISTGGLGPTRDDLTREALAGLVDRPLILEQQSLDHIHEMFERRNREMPERNRLQAMFPEGSKPIFNPQGTAPGIQLQVDSGADRPSHIFALPGVPAEMKRMFDDTVEPTLVKLAGNATCISHLVMKFFGTGESDMEQRLGEMISRDREPRVGITVSSATISLRITATADGEAECAQAIQHTKAEILDRVGDLYFGDGEFFEQHHAIEKLLSDQTESLCVVELGYAAPLGDWFSELGATNSYRGGLSFCEPSDLLRFTKQTSLDGALVDIRDQFDADWLLLVEGYPQLSNGEFQPMGACRFRCKIVSPTGESTLHEKALGGHPSIIQARIAKTAMMWFRKVLSG